MDLPDWLRKLKPILGEEEFTKAWEQLQLADPKTARLLEFSLRKKLADTTGVGRDNGDILLDPIPKNKSAGDLDLGRVHYGRQALHLFALRPSELIQHTAIFGRSGAGKTNVAFLLLRELSGLRVPFLVFDWKKNYRDLLRVRVFDDLVVYTVGRDEAPFFFNPLIPPQGTRPKEWIKKLAEIMAHSYFLGEGVLYVLQEAIDSLYREFGVYDSSGTWPTFRDLHTRLRARPVKGREASWMESTLRAVGVLNFGAMDQVLNSGAHFPIEQLLKQKAVLELDGLANSDKTFLIEALLLWIHHHRMNEPGRERLKHVLLVEEAHHVLLKKKQEMIGAEAVTDVILREVREFGEAIVLLDQLPSLISKPALENSFTTITMNLKEKGDVTAAAKAMLLESDEARYLGRLPVGSAVVKLQARWVKPFLVRFPLFRIRKGVVTDYEVHERYKDSLDAKTAARMIKDGADSLVRLAYQTVLKRDRRENKRTEEKVEFDDEARALLKDVQEHPSSNITERYFRLGLSAKRGTKLVARLESQGLAESTSVPVPGSHVRVLTLTGKGRELLGLPTEDTNRRGGPEHLYWIERIYLELKEAGIKVEKEAPIGEGKTVDLLVTRGGKRIAIEVETGKSDWRGNVRKCLEAGLDQVLVSPTRPSATKGMNLDTLELAKVQLVSSHVVGSRLTQTS